MSRSTSPVQSDDEDRDLSRVLYERGRLKGAALRAAEKARRKAKLPPPTLNEVLRDRYGTPSQRHTVGHHSPQVDPLDAIESAYCTPASSPSETSEIPAVKREETPEFLREALALPLRERLAQYGFLVGIPFGCDIPKSLLSETTRWELPAWSVAAKYDALRDEFYCDLVAGTVDQTALDAELVKRGLRTRSMRPDEVNLTGKQRAHLRRLRLKLKAAKGILEANLKADARRETIARARSYLESALGAIREARVAYGLAPVDPG